MREERITVEKLAFGGNGVGRINGKICFVPCSCPGDELLVRVTVEKRSYLTAGIVEIISPGPDRVVPPCPLFGSCGGCNWQHVSYQRQLSEKRQIFSDALWRGGRVPGELIGDVLPSPDTFGYRSRVQFKLHGESGRLKIGFYRQGTHFVEDASQGCPIAKPVVNQALERLRTILPFFPELTWIPQINIDCGEQGAIGIINYNGSDSACARRFFEERRSELEPLTGIYLKTGKKTTLLKVFGDDTLEYSLPGISPDTPTCSLSYRPGGFAQVNTEQNSGLLKLVQRFADCRGDERILDLFCGNGNFSLPLAGCCASVTGIEEYGDSIAAAIDNSQRNGIQNAEFIRADAAVGVGRLVAEGRTFECVLLDPPRGGAAELVGDICRLKPEKIIYVSCDPATLARDCGLLSASGYQVQASVPVDMFPQTFHIESVTLLQRANEGL